MSGTPRAVVLLSGGMDSTTLLYSVLDAGYEAVALSVHYGQRHKKELSYAQATAERLRVEHRLLDLGSISELLSGSALTTPGVAIPEGHYAAANMALTVVPNRNAVLLSLAYSLAVVKQARKVCTAVHAGDHAVYPDCRPGFIIAFEQMQREAIDREIYGMDPPHLYAPFLQMTKGQIVATGARLGVPWPVTWSCYQGGDRHCGRCGTCVERVEAFQVAGVVDPTPYQDKEFALRILSTKRT